MKNKIALVLFLLVTGVMATAQIKIGVKAAYVYDTNDDISTLVNKELKDVSENFKDASAWQAGVFTKIGLPINGLFIQPEVLYGQKIQKFNKIGGKSLKFKESSINVPVLLGANMFRYVRVVAGPVLEYNLKSDLKTELDGFKEIEQKDINLGLQFGVGAEIKHFIVEARYERGLTKNEIDFVTNNTNADFSLEKKQNQFILSVGYVF